ncbi:hypothetical protein [Williamsia sp. DF01-3]|uniref:hypothetical protein n=1 Tax=Williamsia sp. DF01-3 TaxID=2934157 RepID=UPI001FF63A23|nr:hypothetical protein [Williamsia sp. DF01-3]MCK0516401.1 hypothetical protein [Williamsia sp. DF01-3]
MTEIGEPSDIQPVEDVLEQQQDVDPDQADVAEDAGGSGPLDADPADVREQEQVVTAPLEDEYRED